MSIALSEAHKEAIRYHLGYDNVDPTTALVAGFPAVYPKLRLVETAMERINGSSAVSRIARIVTELESIEKQMSAARCRFKVQQLGELKLRNSNDEASEADMLAKEYSRWRGKLAQQLGVPINGAQRGSNFAVRTRV